MVLLAWPLGRLVSFTGIASLTPLASPHGSTILQPFPFGDLVISRVTIINPNDQVGIFLR